jgi:hypothetical protein
MGFAILWASDSSLQTVPIRGYPPISHPVNPAILSSLRPLPFVPSCEPAPLFPLRALRFSVRITFFKTHRILPSKQYTEYPQTIKSKPLTYKEHLKIT